ncbi:autophagy protein atg9 [Quaeritorhiza haematococci]|nr:autophagy protein atg9 [Quaeritorhiza haematococci]
MQFDRESINSDYEPPTFEELAAAADLTAQTTTPPAFNFHTHPNDNLFRATNEQLAHAGPSSSSLPPVHPDHLLHHPPPFARYEPSDSSVNEQNHEGSASVSFSQIHHGRQRHQQHVRIIEPVLRNGSEPLQAQQPYVYTPPTLQEEDERSEDSEAPPSLMIEMNPLTGAPTEDTESSPDIDTSHSSPFRRLGSSFNRRGLMGSISGIGGMHRRFNSDMFSTTRPKVPPKQEAMRIWNQKANEMDRFLCRVYDYFLGKGFLCILLSRITNLLVVAFIVIFPIFTFACVDYTKIHEKPYLWDVLRPNCMTRLLLDLPHLWEMRKFYTHLLEISEADIQTVSWREVLIKLIQTRSGTGGTETAPLALDKLDAYNIANRILRKDNYMIAMINKDILNLSVPLLSKRQFLTKIVEWNLSFCILSYVFDEHGSVRKRFLKDTNRARLVNGLRRRFAAMAILNLLFAPFLLVFLVLYFFFRYAEEYHKDPSTLGARQYSQFAWWKFREFNEWPHLFRERLNRSYPKSNKYMDQFPNEHVVIVARFVAFISGAFAAVLAILTLVDKDLLLGFEITPGATALFYIGLFGGIHAVSRGLIPEDHRLFEPERLLREVIEETHYLPSEWRGKLHTDEVRRQFGVLFSYKILLFLHEILSVVMVPLILWFSLPPCSEAIVDFFREFTVHVDGLGYVCSFAGFDFRRHGNFKYGARTDVHNEYYMSKEGKMEQSFIHFKAHNPEWEPPMDGSHLLANVLSRRNELSGRMYGHLPDSTSSVHISHSLRGKRNVKFNDFSGQPPHLSDIAGRHRGPATLHNQHSIPQQSPLGPHLYPYQMGNESTMLNASEISDGRVTGPSLFALLDAIYESNRTLY